MLNRLMQAYETHFGRSNIIKIIVDLESPRSIQRGLNQLNHLVHAHKTLRAQLTPEGHISFSQQSHIIVKLRYMMQTRRLSRRSVPAFFEAMDVLYDYPETQDLKANELARVAGVDLHSAQEALTHWEENLAAFVKFRHLEANLHCSRG